MDELDQLLEDIRNSDKAVKGDPTTDNKPERQKTQSQREEQVFNDFSRLLQGQPGGLTFQQEMYGDYIDPDRSNSAKFTYGSDNPDHLKGNEDFDDTDIDEIRAQRQGNWGRVSSGLARLIPKVIAEVGSSAGYIAGILPAIWNTDLDYITENFIVEAFQGLDESAKEAFPVYVRNEIENGNFWKSTFSSEFFANESIDALGFLISAIGTGYGLGAVAKGLRVGTGISKIVGQGNKFAGAIDNGIIAGGQTFYEAASEARGIKQELDAEFSQYERDEEGLYILPDGRKLSEDEVKDVISTAQRETMLANGVLLFLPNIIQTRMLFGTGDNLSRSVVGGLEDISSASAIRESLKKINPLKDNIRIGVKEGLKGAGTEAFQEWSQFAIGDYEKKYALGETDDGLFDGLVTSAIDAFSDIEGQQSIFLGAVLGLGPGVIGGIRESKARRKQLSGFSELLSKGDVAFNETMATIMKTDKDGNTILKDGKMQVDPNKLDALLQSTEADLKTSLAFNAALINGDTRTAKLLVGKMATRKLLPYLEVDGGIDIWNAHIEEMTSRMDTETIKQMGFESKEDYGEFLTQMGEVASKEHAKVKDRGPSFYGIDTKHLVSKHMDSKEVNTMAQNFISSVERTAVALKMQEDIFTKEISKTNQQLSEIKSSVELQESETLEDALKREGKDKEVERLTKVKDEYQKLKDKGVKDYNSLFNKKEQQKEFDRLMKDAKEMKAAEEADVEKAFELDEDTKEFYDNLREKGYDVDPSKAPNVNDFGKNRVSLRDAEGNVFKILKQPNRNGGKDKFVLYDMQTKKHQPLTMDILKEKGLNTKEAILTKEEFDEWSRQKRVLDLNERRLEILRGVITTHLESKRKRYFRAQEIKKEMDAYQAELDGWKQLDPEMTIESVVEEIITLEEKIDTLNKELEELYKDSYELDGTLDVLTEMEQELREAIKSNIEFSFGNKIQELKQELEDGKFEVDRQILNENIQLTEEIIDELSNVRDTLQDTLDDMYDVIMSMDNLESLFEGGLNSRKLAQKIMINYPELVIDGTQVSEMTKTQIRKLLTDPDVRRDVVEALRGEKQALMSTYNLEHARLTDINNQLRELSYDLSELKYNSRVLLKYEKLNINYRTLSLRNAQAISRELKKNIADGSIIPNNQKRFFKNSPKEQNAKVKPDKNSAKKHTPWSTISQVYKGDWVDGEYVVRIENGKKVLNDNWQASVTWDKTLSDIPTEDIGNFSVRFVNSAQLEELGAIAPDSRGTALYAVLYKNGTDRPFSTETGIAYAGIAEPETYFKEDGYATIEPERMPEYERVVRGREVSERSPIEYNGETYTSKKDLTDAILEVVKEEYIKWRAETLKKVESDTPQYASLTSISPGQPVLERGKKNKPKDVFDIVELVIPNSDRMKSGGARIPVAPGMVHAKLKNGHIARLLNNRIGDLPDNVQADYLNRIIQFMALATEVRDNFNRKFTFENSTSTIPLFGTVRERGILDYFVNWGHTQSDYGIAIYLENQEDINSQMNILVTMDGNMQKIPIETLFNKNGEVRKHDDPALTVITDFLKTKYMNVNSAAINQNLPNGFYMPDRPIIRTKKGGEKVITIGKKKYKSYNDYVLDNNLYTEVIPYDPLTDKIPNFVNRYVTFGGNVPELPSIKSTPKPEKLQPVKGKGVLTSRMGNQNSPAKGGVLTSRMGKDAQENTGNDSSDGFFGNISEQELNEMYGNQPPIEAYSDEMGGSPIETGVFQAAMERKEKSVPSKSSSQADTVNKNAEKLTPAAQRSYDMLVKEYKENPQPDNIADLEELISSFDNSPAGKAARKGAEALLSEFKALEQTNQSIAAQSAEQQKADTERRRQEFPETQSNTRTPITQKLLDYFAEVNNLPKFTEDLNKGTYISWLQNNGELGYKISGLLNTPKKAFDLIAKYDAEITALGQTNQSITSSRSQVETAKENIEKSKEESKVECNTGKTGKGSIGKSVRVKKRK